MSARTLMIQGTSSNVGKSLIVTALCRIYARRGFKVAPFKSQNMALNSFVTPEGLEIGRAQALQAVAACREASVLFNPVLLKPESDGSSQVVLMGRPWKSMAGFDYYQKKSELWSHVTSCLDTLRQEYDLIIIEGAGSPAEINLKAGDIVNMRIAQYLDAPVLLTADIDRGGVFAFLYGTLELLEAEERKLIKGFIINKFRGNEDLLTPGLSMLADLTDGRPTVGVLPYITDLLLAQEDSVFLEDHRDFGTGSTDIAVIQLPHISNYDDIDALTLEEGVRIRFVRSTHELGVPDAIIIPGSKTTIADLLWLKSTGLAREIIRAASRGTAVAGICGGYQMLGRRILDPEGTEGTPAGVTGLGLLECETTIGNRKETVRTEAILHTGLPLLHAPEQITLSGYQIHMGVTTLLEGCLPLLHIGTDGLDGAVSRDKPVWGSYLHGIFDTPDFRRLFLRSLGWDASSPACSLSQKREEEIDRLADAVEEHLSMDLLDRIIGIS
jgi:adenosylcobyric acid synthase